MDVHGRPGFAKSSIVDDEKEEIAAVHSDFIVWLMPTVPDGICWLVPLSPLCTQGASSIAGFTNHGLTCLAINIMIACPLRHNRCPVIWFLFLKRQEGRMESKSCQ